MWYLKSLKAGLLVALGIQLLVVGYAHIKGIDTFHIFPTSTWKLGFNRIPVQHRDIVLVIYQLDNQALDVPLTLKDFVLDQGKEWRHWHDYKYAHQLHQIYQDPQAQSRVDNYISNMESRFMSDSPYTEIHYHLVEQHMDPLEFYKTGSVVRKSVRQFIYYKDSQYDLLD